jgi:hypothetical protein
LDAPEHLPLCERIMKRYAKEGREEEDAPITVNRSAISRESCQNTHVWNLSAST